MNMGFSPQKLLQTHIFLRDTLSHDVGSLKAFQEVDMGVRNMRKEGVFIGKVLHQLPDKAADIKQP
jgi:hypothetical protein